MASKKILMHTDLCKHCLYIEDGDFICQITQDPTIIGWCPFECQCPKKRKGGKKWMGFKRQKQSKRQE